MTPPRVRVRIERLVLEAGVGSAETFTEALRRGLADAVGADPAAGRSRRLATLRIELPAQVQAGWAAEAGAALAARLAGGVGDTHRENRP